MTESLYTPTEVKKIRDKLAKEQNNIDPILKEPFKETIACDHDHTTQHVRAALNRNCNAFEGLVFNAHKRCLGWLTDKPLPVILRNLADYLEQDYSHNPYHPGWLKRVKTLFNQLSEKQKDKVLSDLGYEKGVNSKQRKEIFAKLVLDRKLGYDTIREAIQSAKEEL